MGLSLRDHARLADELQSLVGARAQKLSVTAVDQLAIDLRLPGKSVLLLASSDPALARIGVITLKPQAPERPFAFQGLLRKELAGARLKALVFEPSLRHFRLRWQTAQGARSIVVEAGARGGSLVLLDAADRVLGHSGHGKWRRGEPFSPPPIESSRPDRDRLPEAGDGDFPLSAALERIVGGGAGGEHLAQVRAQRIAPLRAAIKRLQRTIEKVRGDRARIAEAERFRVWGDLLKTELSRIPRGAREVRAVEYTADGPVERVVPLQPHLSARENMERYYHQQRRLSRSAALVDERLARLQRDADRLANLVAEAQAAPSEEQIETVLSVARAEGLLRASGGERGTASTPGAAPRVPYREYRSRTGQRIWVGRGAKDNDALTFKHARGNDLWLHARGRTGSHVIVPGVGAQGPDSETLLDAAALAAHFSSGRDEGVVEVAATRRKYVQKPRGSAPGSVRFSQERTIAWRAEPERIERLLQSLSDA